MKNIADYQHAHIYHYSGAETERQTMRVVLLTVGMMVVEIIAGCLFNSMALLADGWHMSTHAVALGISWLAFVVARRYALDRRFAFGTWKIEILGGFVSAVLLAVVALAMVIVSVERLLHPVTIQFNQAILIAVVGLLVNLVCIFMLTDHSHSRTPPGVSPSHDRTGNHGNLNLRAAYLHVIADAFTSILAIVALLGGRFMNWTWLDPIMGLVGAVMIGIWTRSLLRETGGILLDRGGDDKLREDIRAAIEADDDTRISDIHVWRVGPTKYACILALVAEDPHSLQTYKNRLKEVHELVHVSIEINLCRDSPGK
ncbi:MAG: CDF family Co(II)/Ni(II) efflux transporter DmeF [Kiritimatiellia bacterium]|nr:CDF family Co(II)/Ni(II) efflux transporter DmeF [Kiritimatiellia bacterium]